MGGSPETVGVAENAVVAGPLSRSSSNDKDEFRAGHSSLRGAATLAVLAVVLGIDAARG